MSTLTEYKNAEKVNLLFTSLALKKSFKKP